VDNKKTVLLSNYVADSSRTIEQFTVRDPEDEMRHSSSIQNLSLRDDTASNGQGQGQGNHARDSVGSPIDSVYGARLPIEDGSVENKPARMSGGRMY